MTIPAWSYSSIKTFDQCPKKYYHLRVAKDIKDGDNTATLYGKEVHTAAENFIKDGTPIPAKYGFIAPTIEALNAIEGEKHCELKLGVAKREGKFVACDFFAPDVWWRGIADLVITNGTKAKVLDYKAGKSAKYADKDQLELMALAVFKHFPDVEEVDAALFFVVAKAFIKGRYLRSDAPALWAKWLQRYDRIIIARDRGVWNPKTSGLCKAHCVVLSCIHNGRNS